MMAQTDAAATPQSNEDNIAIHTADQRVSCNGGGGALGHPQIWLNMTSAGEVTCPYCSRHFIHTKAQD